MNPTTSALLLACAAFGASAQPASPAASSASARMPVVKRIVEPPLRVTDLAVQGSTVWAATRGGGIVRIGDGHASRIDVGPSLPSATVWSVQPWQGKLLAATDNGLVLLDPATGTSRRLLPPGAAPASGQLSADFVRLAARGERPLAQFSLPDGTPDRARGLPGLWRLLDAPVAFAAPSVASGGHASVAARDRGSGCLDLAGVAQERDRAVVWWWAECRHDTAPRVTVFRGAQTRDAVGVSAIARDPRTGRPVLAIVQSRGPEPQRRRHVLLEATPHGVLQPHCSHADYAHEVTGLLPDPVRRGLVVALFGDGVHAVSCADPRGPLGPDVAELREATALAHGPGCVRCLLVASQRGVFLLTPRAHGDGPMDLRALHVAGGFAMPEDAIPTDVLRDGRRVLVSSATTGIVELERDDAGWRPVRRWAARDAAPLGTVDIPTVELPTGAYGAASYSPAGGIDVVIRSQGVRHVDGAVDRWLDDPLVGTRPHVLGAKATPTGDTWVAIGSTPAAPVGGLIRYPRTDPRKVVPLPDAQVEPTGALLAWPDGRLWSASRSGIVEAGIDGRSRLVSRHRVQAIFRNEAHPEYVGAVGATVERWTGKAFEPVLFRIEGDGEHPEVAGHPIDVVIDAQGAWLILYSSGHIVQLDASGAFVRVLGPAQGVPPSARRLLYVPDSDEVLIGAGRDGLFLLNFR